VPDSERHDLMPGETSPRSVTKTIDARGTYCPGPLLELVRAIKEGQVGDVIAVLSADSGSKADIPAWTVKAGHTLVGIYVREGYDEIVVEKTR
jgi:tRNA 2-thiouridine synthesizing protein A